MIKWEDSFLTGIAKLDQQHKNLFQYCNDLGDGINSGEISQNVLSQALVFLGKYIKIHFGKEETCMNKYSCPIAEKNKFAHQKFINAYQKFQKMISENKDSGVILRELHYFLENWLIEHICKIDTQLKTCISK
jgi:hemerythrin